MTTPEKNSKHEANRLAARWSAIGIQIGVSVTIGTLAGMWLDKKFETGTKLTLVGILVGVAAASYDIYRLVKQTQHRDD